MIRLLSIEFQKLRYSKPFWVFVLLYFVLIGISGYVMGDFKIAINKGINVSLSDSGLFNFPGIWQNLTFILGYFKVLLVIIFISFVANEYSYRTIKQNLIDGLSKKEFLTSKLLMAFVVSTVATLFVSFEILALGYSFSSSASLSLVFSRLDYVLAFLLNTFGYLTIGIFLSILIKKTGFSLITLILLFPLEAIGKWSLPNRLHPFFPLESLSNLIREPFSRLGKAINPFSTEIHSVVYWSDMGIVIVWIIVFISVSYYLLKRRDL